MKFRFSGRMPGFMALAAITVVSGLALGGTYTLTEDRIHEQAEMAADQARRMAMPMADEFRQEEVVSGAIDWCFEAFCEEENVGYVAQTTVKGFGGPIEIIAGVDNEGRITGVSVGGSAFAETPGLGANAKNKAFSDKFIGKHSGITVVKAGKDIAENGIDAIASATVTSNAVANGVNIICEYVENIEKTEAVSSASASEAEVNKEGGAL